MKEAWRWQDAGKMFDFDLHPRESYLWAEDASYSPEGEVELYELHAALMDWTSRE